MAASDFNYNLYGHISLYYKDLCVLPSVSWGTQIIYHMGFFWLSTQQIYQKLNQYASNITLLHWFYLVTDTCFDP
jgi:hypothetical protein